jgi:hypothetical protein
MKVRNQEPDLAHYLILERQHPSAAFLARQPNYRAAA